MGLKILLAQLPILLGPNKWISVYQYFHNRAILLKITTIHKKILIFLQIGNSKSLTAIFLSILNSDLMAKKNKKEKRKIEVQKIFQKRYAECG